MFKGLGQIGDMAKIMKQAQEMQSKMTDMQSKLENIEVLGESGAGLVKVKCSAKGKVTSLEIDKTILQPSEKEVIEDLIVAAVADAQQKAALKEKQEMESMGASLGLPEGMKLPF
ncbi:MAG: YbaB/EbfC family nucleoid-associated protein [Pseudomonadota bacterium]|nr:YbaB/EbfC family nucleoid-associated protein [Pseudomonadota bacterium]